MNGTLELLLVGVAGSAASTIARYFSLRGFGVVVADDGDIAVELARTRQPSHVVLDLGFPDLSSLRLVARLKAASADSRVVVLTSYASIASAVEAIKFGATDYLPKPVDAAQVLLAFERNGEAGEFPAAKVMSVNRLVWEHINRVFMSHYGNVSATARALSMHRRTLQRMLQKHAFKD